MGTGRFCDSYENFRFLTTEISFRAFDPLDVAPKTAINPQFLPMKFLNCRQVFRASRNMKPVLLLPLQNHYARGHTHSCGPHAQAVDLGSTDGQGHIKLSPCNLAPPAAVGTVYTPRLPENTGQHSKALQVLCNHVATCCTPPAVSSLLQCRESSLRLMSLRNTFKKITSNISMRSFFKLLLQGSTMPAWWYEVAVPVSIRCSSR